VLVVAAEFGLAGLVLAKPLAAPSLVLLEVVLLVFTGDLLLQLVRKNQVSCGCYGGSGSAVTPGKVATNLVL
jgi:hypothetical protein